MNPIIVQTSKNVTLLGAGEASKALLAASLKIAPYLVAVDGGAELALNCGETPKKVIGDFDSISRSTLAQIPVGQQHHITEQDSTDFEKCLSRIVSPLILGVGFLGRRVDHQLAAFNALVRHNASPCVLIGKYDLVFHLVGELDLDLKAGSRLSLFPMRMVQGESLGLQWPVNGMDFAPDGRIGTSNTVLDGPVRLKFQDPGMLVILPPEALVSVVKALLARSDVRAR